MKHHVFSRAGRAGLILALAAQLTFSAACGKNPAGPNDPVLYVTELVLGTGARAEPGRVISVHYTGWFYDPTKPEEKGAQFTTSRGGQPYAFFLGYGQVISGWDQGLPGMLVGGQRRLVVPPELAYGPYGSSDGAIPPNATLVFDVELVSIQGA